MKVITVKNISKEYRLGSAVSSSIKDSFNNAILKRDKKKHETFVALNDISFDVMEGDVLGIMGKNGAGKSTLLKILSRITQPSSGRITMKGRVASLLEVGTGFHPELTGMENIYLNGAILGMSRKEVKQKFDEIVDFSGVEKFISTPVKHYSSGMYVRLAFAVAAHLEPEILIIDEVLAVGDVEFQKKCLGKMKNVASQGRTVLFVSHNMPIVSKLCKTGIVLESGNISYTGTASDCVNYYLGQNKELSSSREWQGNTGPGNDSVRLKSISIDNSNKGEIVYISSNLELNIGLNVIIGNKSLDVTLRVRNSSEEVVFTDGYVLSSEAEGSKVGLYNIRAKIPNKLLNAGTYTVDLVIGENKKYVVLKEESILAFEVNFGENLRHDSKLVGTIYQELDWSVNYNPTVV